MLALVATAVCLLYVSWLSSSTHKLLQLYASIEDYKNLQYDAGEFKANLFIDAYRLNIETLSDIKTNNLPAYHALMHGL